MYLEQRGDEYVIAIELLRRRYEPAATLEASKIIKLTELQRINDLEDTKFARKIFDRAVALSYGMGNPELKDKLNNQIMSNLLGKLPVSLRKRWHDNPDSSDKTLKQLLVFID